MSRLLNPTEIDAALATLAGWHLAQNTLRRSLRFRDFASAFAFMTKVAAQAEALHHHPDWSNSHAQVEIALTTHNAGGITDLDVELALRIEALAAATP